MVQLCAFCPHSVEVVDDISRVAAPEVRHGHGDLLVVVAQVDADIFLQLLTPAQRSVRRVLVKHPAVEQVLLRDLQHNAQRKISVANSRKVALQEYPFVRGLTDVQTPPRGS